jgi:putative transposase
MKKAFKFRLDPTAEQKRIFSEWLNTCRVLYNQSLSERTSAYERDKTSISYYTQTINLTQTKKENPWLKSVNAQVLQDTLKRLDNAYQNFFRRVKQGEKPGYPRYKSIDRFDSCQ